MSRHRKARTRPTCVVCGEVWPCSSAVQLAIPTPTPTPTPTPIPPAPRRTTFDTGTTLETIANEADARLLLEALRRELDFACRGDPTQGYDCTQALNQLHRALLRDPIDLAEVCGILDVTRDTRKRPPHPF